MTPTLTADDALRTIRQECGHCRRPVVYGVPADVAPSLSVECPRCLMRIATNTLKISRRLSEDVRGVETPGPDRRAMLAEAVEGLRSRGDDFHRALADHLASFRLPPPPPGPKGQRFPLGRIFVTLSAANAIPRIGDGTIWSILDKHACGYVDERTNAADYVSTERDRQLGTRASNIAKASLALETGQGSFVSTWPSRPTEGTTLRPPVHGGVGDAVSIWTVRSGDDADTLVHTAIDRVQAM